MQITISNTPTILEVQCGEGEVYDPAVEGCRPVVCTKVFESGHGGCNFPSNENISCAEVLIQLTEDDDFQFVNNTTVLYSDALHDVAGMLDGSPVICINFSSNGTMLVNETDIQRQNHGAFNFTSLNDAILQLPRLSVYALCGYTALIARVVASRLFRLCNSWLP